MIGLKYYVIIFMIKPIVFSLLSSQIVELSYIAILKKNILRAVSQFTSL